MQHPNQIILINGKKNGLYITSHLFRRCFCPKQLTVIAFNDEDKTHKVHGSLKCMQPHECRKQLLLWATLNLHFSQCAMFAWPTGTSVLVDVTWTLLGISLKFFGNFLQVLDLRESIKLWVLIAILHWKAGPETNVFYLLFHLSQEPYLKLSSIISKNPNSEHKYIAQINSPRSYLKKYLLICSESIQFIIYLFE